MDYILVFKKKTRLLSIFVLTAIFTISLITSLQADTPSSGLDASDPSKNTEGQSEALFYMPGQLVVKFNSDTVKTDVFGDKIDGTVVDYLENTGVYLYSVSRDANSYSLAEEVETMSGVDYAHPNYTINPLHPVQGSYPFSDDTKTGDIRTQASVNTLELTAAQQYATGENVTVAVIDGGIDDTHEFLAGSISSGLDYIDGDDYAFDEDGGYNTGHGTFVAGVVHLVAPDAVIKSYRVTDPNGAGDGFTLAKAIEQAVLDGCDIINLSVVLMEEHFAVRDAVNFARAHNVAVVAAAGNAFSELPVYPAAEDNTFAVTAIDTFNVLAGFSSYGSHIDVCAPGTRIYSAYRDNGYAWWSGTSFSTPFVSGQLALLKSMYPEESVSELEDEIRSSTTDIDGLNEPYTGKIGDGLINPYLSLNMATEGADSIWAEPDTLYFTYQQGLVYTVVLEESFLLSSSNAPAQYVGRITTLEGDPVFLTPEGDLNGFTNDEVTVYLTNYDLTAGLYYNNIRFFAQDVAEPVDIVVSLTVTPPEHQETAAVVPALVSAWAPVGADTIIVRDAALNSSNSPAAYTATVKPGGDQISYPENTTGYTGDSIRVYINTALASDPGYYYDTIMYTVEGVPEPAYLLVELEIRDGSPMGDTAWINNGNWQSFTTTLGSNETFEGYFHVLSSNMPAEYLVEPRVPVRIPIEFDTMGVTGDSLNFTITTDNLPVDIYHDTLLIIVAGVIDNPLTAIIDLHVEPDPGPVEDSAWTYPQALEFTHIYGSETFAPMMEYVTISASNTPADFVMTVLTDSDPVFVTPYEPVYGTTHDSVLITANPFTVPVIDDPVLLPPGVYYNTLQFTVDGIANPVYVPVMLTVIDEDNPVNTAGLTPNTFYLTGVVGTDTDLYCYAQLTSSNAPAQYQAAVLPGGSNICRLLETTGTTDCGVTVVVDPELTTEVGTYHDSVAFYIEGVTDPVYMFVNFMATEADDTAEFITVVPGQLSFTAVEGEGTILSDKVFLNSTPQGSYTTGVEGYGFTVLEPVPGAVTPDTVEVHVFTYNITEGPGKYYDTVLFFVEGFENPAKVPVVLEITPSGDYDTGWVYPLERNYLAYQGKDMTQIGAVDIGSDNQPAPFTVEVLGVNDFISLTSTSGNTGDSFFFNVVSIADMAPGVYSDTLNFYIEGVYNNPYQSIAYLFIDSVIDDPDPSFRVYPYLAAYGAYLGEDLVQTGTVYVGSSDNDFTYQVEFKDNPDVTVLLNTEGPVNDTIHYEIHATASMPEGTYADTLLIHFSDPDNTTKMSIVNLTITDYNEPDTIYVEPEELYVTLLYGSTDPVIQKLVLSSSNAPAAYTAGDVADIYEAISFESTTGCTEDSVTVIFDPTSLPLGNDTALLWFDVEGIDERKHVPVYISVVDDTVHHFISVSPEELLVTIPYGATDPVIEKLFLSSTNSPAQYYTNCIGDVFGGVSFEEPVGYTNDTVAVIFDPTLLDPEMDTLLLEFEVDGIEAKKYMIVTLIFEDETPADSIILDPPRELEVIVPYGATDPITEKIFIGSTNAPAAYAAGTSGDINGCITVENPTGYTDDTVVVTFDPTCLEPGVDTILLTFSVEGIATPKGITVFLMFESESGGPSMQNYPNPFNPETNIEFTLNASSNIRLEIFNILGQQVVTLADEQLTAGTHIYTWRGKDSKGQNVSSGIYFYRLTTDKTSLTKKMLLLK